MCIRDRDLHQNWYSGSSRGRNQLWQFFWQSVKGFGFCRGPKFAISHWLSQSPLTQCWRYSAARDKTREIVFHLLCVQSLHLPPEDDCIERVCTANLLGAVFYSNINIDSHNWYISALCSQHVYFLKLLCSRGFNCVTTFVCPSCLTGFFVS